MRREKVIEIWNSLIRPVVNEGVVDEWTVTALLLQGTVDGPSEADITSKDETQIERVTEQISRTIQRFRQ